jgi:N-acyl-D-amino-acid deacylase
MLDLVIRDGLIVDGSGLPGRRGDVSIHDGRVVAVGGRAGESRRVLDATGQVVAPGFIDPHTHYDAQLCFDPYAFPAIEHGVTTVVPGNCSLSLAPLRTDHRDAFSRMFRLIEEMPEAAFDAGVDWRWGEGFGAWLDTLAGDIALNVVPLVGHSVIRMFVMGPDAQQRPATAEEVRAMADLLRVCLDAGAVGLSTSFVDIDETYRPVPSRWAAPAELDALAPTAVVATHRAGVGTGVTEGTSVCKVHVKCFAAS